MSKKKLSCLCGWCSNNEAFSVAELTSWHGIRWAHVQRGTLSPFSYGRSLKQTFASKGITLSASCLENELVGTFPLDLVYKYVYGPCGDMARQPICPPTMWILKVKPRSSGLAAGAFTGPSHHPFAFFLMSDHVFLFHSHLKLLLFVCL